MIFKITNQKLKKIHSALKIFLCVFIFIHFASSLLAQSTYNPYSYFFDQKLNKDLYDINTREHSSIKWFFDRDSVLKIKVDSILRGPENRTKYSKYFQNHLIESNKSSNHFYLDLLPEIELGRDFANAQTPHSLSLGVQTGGNFGKNLDYYISFFYNNSVFLPYLNTYIHQVGVIPGAGTAYKTGNGFQWTNTIGQVSYNPNTYLNISGGIDKNFLGDGYRSLLLSDYAAPYPFFKLTGTLGNVQYMALWSFMDDPAFTSQYGVHRKKFGVFHYMDWNISNRVSLGFFENVMAFFTDDNGVKRPFDLNYINPIIFLKPVNNSSNDPDKSFLGITSKYKITKTVLIYGQFALNEFHSKDFFSSNGAFDNKYGWQLGIRGSDLFGFKTLNYLLETNNVKPYTYSARSEIENYSESSEPLAHPWGANFRELVGLLNFSKGKFDFGLEADYGHYGLDSNMVNNGKDIFKLYTNYVKEYGNFTGQGIATNMIYLNGKVVYLLNPKTNLRLELNALYRREKNYVFNDQTQAISISLKSSFRNFYHDLSSYKIH